MLELIKENAIKFITVTKGVSKSFDVSFNPLTGHLENAFRNIYIPIGYKLCPTHLYKLQSAYHAMLIEDNRAYLEFSYGCDVDDTTWIRVVSQIVDTRITRTLNNNEIADILIEFLDDGVTLFSEFTHFQDDEIDDNNTIRITVNDDVIFDYIIPIEYCYYFKLFIQRVFSKMIFANITFTDKI